MFKEIKVGEQTIGFLSNGATPLYYKQTFGNDLLKSLNSSGEFELASDKMPELAFIMAMQAEKADMKMLNMDKYIEFLERFDALDLQMASSAIIDVYLGNSLPTEKPKKKVKG